MDRRDFMKTGALSLVALLSTADADAAQAEKKNQFPQFLKDIQSLDGIPYSSIEEATYDGKTGLYFKADNWNLEPSRWYMGKKNHSLDIVDLGKVINDIPNSMMSRIFMAAPEKGVHFKTNDGTFNGNYLLIGSDVERGTECDRYDAPGSLNVLFRVNGKTARFREDLDMQAAYRQIVRNLS